MTTANVDTLVLGELKCWRITTAQAELVIAQQGAQILRYQRAGQAPLLWLSEQALFKQGKSVRGGVPVCWPWFGHLQRNPEAVQAMYDAEPAPAHGLVRGRDWQLLGMQEQGDTVRVEFDMPQAQGALPDWPHSVELRLCVTMGETLEVTLSNRNLGAQPVTISQALHTYFAVSDVRQVQVHGVEELTYIETLADWQQRTQQSALTFAGETDRIYLDPPTLLSIVDPQHDRRTTLHTQGSRSAVIWNPWTERAAELPDMADEAWQGMLCIETANAWHDVLTLAPGAHHALSVKISSAPLERR
ncbi:D-hexose-6-phosphate mutarotase [Pseudomonas sp. RP23018S]|uniref:D-hexose-6-phosphate mutarotase n=1 Tax=Pseudomonas sp. RP23018S TaxID=3096037 RepID=UPI002ACAF0A2|nr:D-hexose-6-phosphate mutarotase [Pseudomonas sp. RP23018S]MDZ5603095.1 D-hexose-6-phosphate mutarotase [Pseudomonas sp. RP23018S]